MAHLFSIPLADLRLQNGYTYAKPVLTYQVFGQTLGTAAVVVVNHALTGNSNVSGPEGWWSELVGSGKTIDTDVFTVISFNIPGNGYDKNPANLIAEYKQFTVRDIAQLFWNGLHALGIERIFAVIGGSLGGAIAWEMAVLQPRSIGHLIPIATDWKATDWVIAQVLIQDQILNNSDDPIADARLHAMLLYRTPESINQRFGRTRTNESSVFQVERWLLNHGIKLKNRFTLSAYKLMNHLLKTNDITKERADFLQVIRNVTAAIHIVAVDTDLFFTAAENRKTFEILKTKRENIFLYQIHSVHGHDAFLIENEQLSQILNPIFNTQKTNTYVSYNH